jgi:predicted GTPase
MSDMGNRKSQSIAQSVEAVRDELVRAKHVLPVSLAQDLPPYNLDELWTLAAQVLPAAQRKALVRLLAEQGGIDWMHVLPQMVQGGRWMFGAVARDIRNR